MERVEDSVVGEVRVGVGTSGIHPVSITLRFGTGVTETYLIN